MDQRKNQHSDNKSQIILGIDPGTITTGYALLHYIPYKNPTLIDFGVVKPPSKAKLSDRYLYLFNAVEEIVKTHFPTMLAIETQFVGKNSQSAIKLGMARGICLVAAKKAGMSTFEYSPAKIKNAITGSGRATKLQIKLTLKQRLLMNTIPEPEDAADALGIALCHAQTMIHSVEEYLV